MKLMHGVLLAGLFFGVVIDAKIPEAYLGSIFPDKENQCSTTNNFYIEVQSNSSQGELSERAVLENYVQAVCNEILCRKVFHMTMAQKEQMKKLSYDDFIMALLRRDDLCDKAIMALWYEYKNKRWWDWSNEKFENEIKIKDGLVNRRKDREKKQGRQQQEIIRVQLESKKYNLKILQNLDYASPYPKQREVALQKTVNQAYVKHIQTHMLDAQTMGMLQAEGIDHKQFHDLAGTVFQHQLFGEVAQQYKNVAKIVFEYSIKNSCLVPHILEFAQATFDATKMEQFGFAVQLSDVAQLLAETSLSICKGSIQSLCGLAEALYHPKRTVKQLGQALVPILRTLGGVMVEYDHESSACVISMQAAQQVFGSDMQSFNQMCELSRHAFLHWYEHSSGQDKVQVISKVACDIVLHPFLIGKAGKACWGLLSQARELQVLEGLTCLSEELGFAEIAQDVGLGFQEAQELLLATELGLQKLPVSATEIETAIASLMESEVNAVVTSIELPLFKDITPFIEKFRKFNGVIPLENIIFKNEFHIALKQLEKTLKNPMLEQIKKVYSKKMIGNKEVRICLDHICNFELGLKKSKDAGGYILYIGGGHLPGVCEALEEIGLVKIIDIKKLSTGGTHYFMENAFTGKPLEKTVFLEGWTTEKIAQATWNIYHNDSAVSICQNGKFTKSGIVDGCELNIYWNSLNNNGKIIEEIVTCLPIKE